MSTSRKAGSGKLEAMTGLEEMVRLERGDEKESGEKERNRAERK